MNRPECKFELNDRVKLTSEAFQYAKSPSQVQVWKRDRGYVTNIKYFDLDHFKAI